MSKSLYGSNWHMLRRLRLEKDEFCCRYCGRTGKLHIHHIRPLRMGGKNKLWNLIALCPGCHKLDHKLINEKGLAYIPSDEYDSHYYDLTDHDAVMKVIHQLESEGLDPFYLKSLEANRP